MFTVVYQLYRDPAMSHTEFVDYWLNVHRPIAMKMPNARGYEIWPVTDSDADGEAPDGFVVLRFDSEQAFDATHASPEFAAIAEDARKFTRHYTRLVVDVHEVRTAATTA